MRSKDILKATPKRNNNRHNNLKRKKPKRSSKGGGGGSSSNKSNKMLTHRVADGNSTNAIREGNPDGHASALPAGLLREETEDDDDSLDNSQQQDEQTETISKTAKAVAAEAEAEAEANAALPPQTTTTTNATTIPRRKKRYMVLFAVFVFFGQIIISVTLKRYGWIEKDFNELVAERLVPSLQEQIETGLTSFSTNFNDSLYWLRINESLGHITQERLRPGFHFKRKGAKAKYPIIMVPGFVTSGLEVWDGKECAKKYFRQRMWGGVGSVQHWLMERHCVLEHLALDPLTGKDPEGIRIRAAQGFEAADYFMGNYWVWGKILENLADIGYDGSTMSIETYDWRLAFPMLEERDGYLTKLKYKIEAFHKSSGEKVVLTSHSMGALLVNYFFAWVTTDEKYGGGGGGKDWVDKHIHAYINIAGAQLGVAKASSALLSGEMSDTVILGPAGDLLEQFIGRKLRRDLWMSWGSLWSMFPMAGDELWDIGADFKEKVVPKQKEDEGQDVEGSISFEEKRELRNLEDDTKGHLVVLTGKVEDLDSMHNLTCVREDLIDKEAEDTVNKKIKEFSSKKGVKTREVAQFLAAWGGGLGPDTKAAQLHSFDDSSTSGKAPSKETWYDISRTPLPHAPNLKIYCLYGVGLDTERSYFYKRNKGDSASEGQNVFTSVRAADTPFLLDTSVEDPENGVLHGIRYSDGDASVPLLSLGYICADAWRRKDSGLNPSMAKVVTREYKHRQEFTVDDPMRGGPYSADHVDILGNFDMMEDFIKVVSDYEIETVEDRFESDILDIARKINEHPNGGLFKRKKRRFF